MLAAKHRGMIIMTMQHIKFHLSHFFISHGQEATSSTSLIIHLALGGLTTESLMSTFTSSILIPRSS